MDLSQHEGLDEKMTHTEKLASEQIGKCITDVRELQRSAVGKDMLVLLTVLERLTDIQNNYQKISGEEKFEGETRVEQWNDPAAPPPHQKIEITSR